MQPHFHRKVLILPLVFLLAASGLACRKKASPVLAVPAPQPAPITAPAQPLEQPPVQQTALTTDPPPALPQPALAPPPVAATPPKKPARRAARPTTPPTATATPTPAEPLHLGEMLTPDQQRQYNSAMDESLQRAQANIARVMKHKLSKEQQGGVAEVQSFIAQAQSMRKTNMTAAKSLAERADVLARELERTVR